MTDQSRPFVSLFGIDPDADITKVAVAAVGPGTASCQCARAARSRCAR